MLAAIFYSCLRGHRLYNVYLFYESRRDAIFKGTQMGSLPVLVCSCFRQKCSLDNFLLKNVIDFSFANQISKWCSFEKGAFFFTYFSHCLVTRQKTETFLQHISHLHHISLTYIHVFCSPYWLFFFFALPILQKLRIFHVWFLFGVTPGVDSFSRFFWSNQWITKWWAKFRLECLLLIFIYTSAKFIVICRTRTLNDGRWRLSSIQKSTAS